MSAFLVLGVAGLILIVVALLLGDLFGGAFEALAGDWFSTEAVGAFVSALGFGGAIADGFGAPGPFSLGVGVVAGIGFGVAGAALTRVVRGGATDDTPAADDIVGHEAVVVTAIPEDGLGSIRVHLGGHTLRFHARTDAGSNAGVDAGTRVHVTGVLSPTAVSVAPLDPLPPA